VNLDFTVTKYGELCHAIANSSYTPVPVGKYLADGVDGRAIILRHDVDDKIKYTLKLAKLEYDVGLSSTYYVRMVSKTFKPEIIREMESLGHEIGYHYEVLDKARGDYEKAIRIFEDELAKLRKVCDVKTMCMHGNPLTRWDNRDLWKHYDFKEFGIIGEAYLSIDYNDVVYFSDTGRTWAGERYRVKDFVDASSDSFGVRSTDDLIDLIKEGRVERMCLLSHLDQWSDGYCLWVRTWVERSVRNFVKANVIRRLRG